MAVSQLVLIVIENNDVNAHLAGVLWLKGMIAYKASNSEDCFNKVKKWGPSAINCMVQNNPEI
jgi:hypothetical protein